MGKHGEHRPLVGQPLFDRGCTTAPFGAHRLGCAAKLLRVWGARAARVQSRGTTGAQAALPHLPRHKRRASRTGRLARALALLGLSLPLPALSQDLLCRQALALGLDVSASVNAQEYRLQLDGLAAALTHPDVRHALLAVPGLPVRLAVFEWSGPEDQRLLVDWTQISDDTALTRVTTQLRTTTRRATNPTTALGVAMLFGADLLNSQQACWRRTLDISGDGRSNTGPRPQDVRDSNALGGITVNALVIGSDHPDGGVPAEEIKALRAHFETKVIRGPDAFTEVALGFEDYEKAMIRKLLRETEGLAIGLLPPAR